jgi:hypothetical protein
MSNINDGGPAFPTARVTINGVDTQDGLECFGAGLSLRDYFAAKAVQGWLANSTATPVEAGIEGEDASPQDMADVAAAFAYMVADAMLKMRESGAA